MNYCLSYRKKIRARAAMPPLRKGGMRRQPQGGSTGLGCESVPGDRLRPCCARELDAYRSEATDTRACRVDPACLGVAETVLPLRRGGIGYLPGQRFSLFCPLRCSRAMPPLRKGGTRRSRRGDRRGWGVSLFRATDCVPAAPVSWTHTVLRQQTHGPAASTPPVSA